MSYTHWSSSFFILHPVLPPSITSILIPSISPSANSTDNLASSSACHMNISDQYKAMWWRAQIHQSCPALISLPLPRTWSESPFFSPFTSPWSSSPDSLYSILHSANFPKSPASSFACHMTDGSGPPCSPDGARTHYGRTGCTPLLSTLASLLLKPLSHGQGWFLREREALTGWPRMWIFSMYLCICFMLCL